MRANSEDEIRQALRGDASISEELGHDLPKETESKWGNKAAVSSDGQRFDSQLERDTYEYLLTMKEAGKVEMILRQTRLDLSPERRMRIDFLVFWADGSVSFIDAKGRATDAWRAKKDIAEDKYPITIDTITREDLP